METTELLKRKEDLEKELANTNYEIEKKTFQVIDKVKLILEFYYPDEEYGMSQVQEPDNQKLLNKTNDLYVPLDSLLDCIEKGIIKIS